MLLPEKDKGNLCDDVSLPLNLIHGGGSPKAKSKTPKLKPCLNCGRHMTCRPSNDQVFGVSNNDLEYLSVVEKIPKKSGCQNLCNILLLITPVEVTSRKQHHHKVHSYCLDSWNHLGVTTLTQEELRLIESQQRPNKYSIVHCTQHIELYDAVRNSPIRDQIFQMVRKKAKAVHRTWYRGNVVRLSYRSHGPRFVGVSPIRNPYGIQSLEYPKIPVRMQHQTPSTVANINCSDIKDMDQRLNLRRKVHRELFYASQQSLEKKKPCRMLKKSAFCRHKSRRTKKFIPKIKMEVQTQNLVDNHEPITQQDLQNIQELAIIPQRIEIGVLELRESLGQTYLPSDSPLKPTNYLLSAYIHLEGELPSPSVRQYFSQFAHLIEQINQRLCPRQEHVQEFFRIAEFQELKMFLRPEISLPGFPSTEVPRFRIECFLYDNRQDYITSIALPCLQVRVMSRMFPRATENFRYVESAFELTNMPLVLTNWLRSFLESIGAKSLYVFFGDITWNWVCPRSALFKLIKNQGSKKL